MVEKASVAEATHEQQHRDRKVQGNVDAGSRSPWLKQRCGDETERRVGTKWLNDFCAKKL